MHAYILAAPDAFIKKLLQTVSRLLGKAVPDGFSTSGTAFPAVSSSYTPVRFFAVLFRKFLVASTLTRAAIGVIYIVFMIS